MKSVYSPRHHGHSGNVELVAGAIVPAYEMPSRAEFVLSRLNEVKLGPVIQPDDHSLATAAKVHDKAYLDFLPTIYDRWKAEGRTGTALPFTWPTRGLRGDKLPEHIDGQLGFYSFDGGCGFVEGTWDAIKSSHDVALTAASLVNGGERATFALCRPPGHHSGHNFMAGYCYINNAAVAAQWFLDQGAKRVSILDVDYHHGNGTQEIFYRRSDVQVINLHADPMQEYPYFLGHADETGEGAGEGFNLNYPMRWGTSWETWNAALEDACSKLAAYAPDVVVLSLGVDTYEKDPISKFKLKTEDFPKIGARIARLGLSTLVVMEGGYAVADIGTNAVGVLTGFEGG
jgi:acetoin utilization deacetylase AcuC-like enzyme